MRTVLAVLLFCLAAPVSAQVVQTPHYGPSVPIGGAVPGASLRPLTPAFPSFDLPRFPAGLSLTPMLPAVASLGLAPSKSFFVPAAVAYRPSALRAIGLSQGDDEDPDHEPGRRFEPVGDLPNLRQVDAGLWRSAQPTAEGFRQTRELGVRTVLLLRLGVPDGEKTVVERLGMRFVHVPMHGMTIPTIAEVDRALKVIEDEGARPVLVHCRHGRDRTGTVVAAYRVVVQGWTIDAAYKEAMSFGYIYKGLRGFLEKYKRHRE